MKIAFVDVECYVDYFLVSVLDKNSRKIVDIEMFEGNPLDHTLLHKVMRNYTTVGFNSNNYDLLMIAGALRGYDCKSLKELSDHIILNNAPKWQTEANFDILVPSKWDHIDIMELPIGRSSLKIYGGRLNAPKLQDLPIDPSANITPNMRNIMRPYCHNDLFTTELLFDSLVKPITLRCAMSNDYGLDLRSKSDAQIGEAVIRSELTKLTGTYHKKPIFRPELKFNYKDPKTISFKDLQMNETFNNVLEHKFTLNDKGSVVLPEWLKSPIELCGNKYKMGIGGLHSCEKSQYIEVDHDHLLFDLDVASYYPNIILEQELSPKHLGRAFIKVYEKIVKRRLEAKKKGDKSTADTLKIVINGSFGKLGSRYSLLYSPELLIQTTLTGQLALLMLIERVSSTGAKVVSANTDGIVVLCHRSKERAVMEQAWDWELDTTYILERTDYTKLASRDVNNYAAVTVDGKVKGKGCFADGGLAKNPDAKIVFTAVKEFLNNGTPLDITINECRDLSQFITLRRVTGGAIWKGEELGKAIRYYRSNDPTLSEEYISYKKNGNKVPKSISCRPAMDLPCEFPSDVDFNFYVESAKELLNDVGYNNA